MKKDPKFYGSINIIAKYMQFDMQRLLTQYMIAESDSKESGALVPMAVIHCKGHFHRWSQKQQEILAAIILEYLRTSEKNSDELQQCIKTLASLSFVDSHGVISLASDERPQLREVAVRKLAQLDSGEGIPVLLQTLGDARSQIAIYSLCPYLLRENPSKALRIL